MEIKQEEIIEAIDQIVKANMLLSSYVEDIKNEEKEINKNIKLCNEEFLENSNRVNEINKEINENEIELFKALQEYRNELSKDITDVENKILQCIKKKCSCSMEKIQNMDKENKINLNIAKDKIIYNNEINSDKILKLTSTNTRCINNRLAEIYNSIEEIDKKYECYHRQFFQRTEEKIKRFMFIQLGGFGVIFLFLFYIVSKLK